MGIYEMIEDNQASFLGGSDQQSFEKFINGIASLNRAFQQVKFWEFTQPCLFLARALPYISTGRTVEGFLVRRAQHCSFQSLYLTVRSLLTFYVTSTAGFATWNYGHAFYRRGSIFEGILLVQARKICFHTGRSYRMDTKSRRRIQGNRDTA
jgi:hypothetical protein